MFSLGRTPTFSWTHCPVVGLTDVLEMPPRGLVSADSDSALGLGGAWGSVFQGRSLGPTAHRRSPQRGFGDDVLRPGEPTACLVF